MSFRGKNTSRFRRSGSHDKPFRGRGRSSGHFDRRDFDQQIDITDMPRGGRGKRFSKHSRPNLRSPRSHRFRGGYNEKRGRDFRHFEARKFRRFSPQRSLSPNEWLGEGSTHFIDDNEELIHQPRRSQSPIQWFDDCDDSELLENCTIHSNGRPMSPLIIHRNFEREDFENARERSLERRERSPISNRSRSLERHPFRGNSGRMSNERSRSPISMSFRDEIQISFGRPRSHLSTYSIRSRSLERPQSQISLHSRRYRRENSNHPNEIRRRQNSRLSFRSGRSSENRYLSRSPKRYFGRRSESRFSERSRSFEKRFKRKRSFGRRSNSPFSVRSGSLLRHEVKGSYKGSTTRRSRSPFTSHSRDLERDGFKHDSTRQFNRPGPSNNQTRSFERDERDRSMSRCFSPARRHSSRERSSNVKSHSFKQQYQSQSFDHQRRYHEKRSESSIERFLNDCKQSVEHKKPISLFKQSEQPDNSFRNFKGLDNIVIKRGKSFENLVLPDQIIEQKNQITQSRLSPISSKSGSVVLSKKSQHDNKITEEESLKVSSNFILGNTSELTEKDKWVEKAETLNASDIPTNEENLNLSPISKSSIFEKIELAERKEIERLSPISSQSGSIGKEITKSGVIFADKNDLNLSPISQSSSKDKFSVKAFNLSPISQVECFGDDKSNDVLPTRKHELSNSNDSMQEFLAELERDEISHDERSSPNEEPSTGPFKIVKDTIFPGWKQMHNTAFKEQSNSRKHFSTNENYNLSGKAYFEVADSDLNNVSYSQISYASNNKFEKIVGETYKQSNLKFHTEQLTHRPSQTVCPSEQLRSQNNQISVGQAKKDSFVSYPLKHGVNPTFNRTPQMQPLGPIGEFSTGSAHSQLQKQNISNPKQLTNQMSYIQEKPDQNINKMLSRTGKSNISFPSHSQNVNELQNLSGTPYQNAQYHQSSVAPNLFPRPTNICSSIQTPNNSLNSSGTKNTQFHQDVNKLVPNPQMLQNFQIPKPMEFPTQFHTHQWQTNHLVKNTFESNFPSTNLSLCPQPIHPKWPNQNNSYFAGNVGQIQPHKNSDKLDQNRSNLKLVNISSGTGQPFPPNLSNFGGGSTLQEHNVVQSQFSSEKSQATWNYNNNQTNFNLPNQKGSHPAQPSTTTPADPIDIKKYLAPIFGRNYFPLVFPQTKKEVITISDDEDHKTNIGVMQSNIQNQSNKTNMNLVRNLVPTSVFVEKYRDSPPSPEDFKQMFETFVIFFGARNNSQLEKDPLCVIQESFSRSEKFGPLHVEECEEYHDFLPVPKQACILRWNGVLLAKGTSYSKEEARHKAGISLINALAHICYTVQAKYSYYCGGKLPKFMLKKSELPGIYKIVERDEIINAVTSTLKTLKEKNYFTGKGVDATHVRVVLGIIDDFFRDKSTFCELIFGSQGQSDYTIGELKNISTHVNQLSWLEWRNIGGYGRGLYTAVSRKKSPQELCNYLLATGENIRYKLIPPQDPWIDLLLANCQYNPNIKKL